MPEKEKIVYKERSTTGYKVAVVVLFIIAAVLAYNSFVATGMSTGSGNAVKSVEDIFKILTDGNAEVLSVKEEAAGLFKVVVKTGATGGSVNAQEIYVTGDGSLITVAVLKTEDYKKRLEQDKNFTQCLFDKGARVFGLSNETASVTQVQLLGAFGSRIFVDCAGNVAACQQLGVAQFPTTAYNNSGYPGIQPVQVYTQLTGCQR
jgi:hypothetical protein